MKLIETPIADLYFIEFHHFQDARGEFKKFFSPSLNQSLKKPFEFHQVNFSKNIKRGTVRGLHYQKSPYTESKIVTCISGKVLDVVVDLRKNSASFLKTFATELSQEKSRSLLIPPGFAHGFQTLEENSALLYFHDQPYILDADTGLNPNDPKLNIQWPLTFSEISDKDKNFPNINQTFEGLSL